MGRGFPINSSTKQKLNTQSSTESELVAVDNIMPIVLWTKVLPDGSEIWSDRESLVTGQQELYAIEEEWEGIKW